MERKGLLYHKYFSIKIYFLMASTNFLLKLYLNRNI